MNNTLVLIGAVLVAGAVFVPKPENIPAPAPIPVVQPVAGKAHVAAFTPAPPPVAVPSAGIVLNREPDGHFYADARVNGQSVRFLIDTGATTVALSRVDADRIGLSAPDEAFTAVANGAGGDIAVRALTLDSVAVGSLSAANVQGAVVKEGLQVSLLGQSFLSRARSVMIVGDRMELR